MTPQELFKSALDWFTSTRTFGFDPNEDEDEEGPIGCVYRGPNNERCGIGQAIPDAVYDPRMEQKNIASLVDGYPDLRAVFVGISADTLGNVQSLHDTLARRAYPGECDDRVPGSGDTEACMDELIRLLGEVVAERMTIEAAVASVQ